MIVQNRKGYETVITILRTAPDENDVAEENTAIVDIPPKQTLSLVVRTFYMFLWFVCDLLS